MAYTNGYDLTRVMSSFLGRIGFRQPTISDAYKIVDTPNQASTSGRFFDDFHALVTIKNIKDCHEDPNVSDTDFNTYLTSLRKSVIMRCLNAILGVPEQIERLLLFEKYTNTQQVEVENTGKFVGFQIEVPKSDSVTVQPINIILSFNEDVSFPIYVFKDGKKTHIFTQTVAAIAYESTVVALNDLVLNYIRQDTKGSRFFLGYFQDDLGSAKALRDQPSYWSKQCTISAISMMADKLPGIDFKRDGISWTYDEFGINLELSSFRDHTNAIIKKAALFDEAIGLQMAFTVVEKIVYSTNSNATERKLKSEMATLGAQFDLYGVAPISESPKTISLKTRIEKEFERVRQGFYPKSKSTVINLTDCEGGINYDRY